MALPRALQFFTKSAMYNSRGEIVEESGYIDPTGNYQIPVLEDGIAKIEDLVPIPDEADEAWVHSHITEFYGDIVHVEHSEFHLEPITDREDHKIFHIIIHVVQYDNDEGNLEFQKVRF